MKLTINDVEHGTVDLVVENDAIREFLTNIINRAALRHNSDMAAEALLKFRRYMIQNGKKTIPAKPKVVA